MREKALGYRGYYIGVDKESCGIMMLGSANQDRRINSVYRCFPLKPYVLKSSCWSRKSFGSNR